MNNQQRFSGEWETKRLGNIFSIRVGSSKSRYIESGGRYIIVDMGSVATDGRLIISKHTDYEGDFLKEGDLVMPKDDIGGGKIIGKVAYIDANNLYVLGDHVYALRLVEGHSKFYSYLINCYETNNSLKSKVAGSAQLGLSRKAVEEQEVPVPTHEEQRAIAKVLSDVDGLINALDALIAKKRAIKQATMQQLLTGKTRLPGFSGAWETKRLGKLGTFSKGRGIKRDDISDDGVPCIRYGELYTRYQDYILKVVSRIPPGVAETALPIKTGDLLFAGSGETAEEIGRCAAYLGEEQTYAGGDVIVLTPSGQNSIYLGHLMNSPTVSAQKARMGQGDAVVHIYINNLAQVQIELPPIDEQRAIASVLSDMDTEITALEHRRDKTIAIKQGMMQQLLTGKVRLLKSE